MMASVDQLQPACAARLVELAGRLKHDLGKYVALQQRWVEESASFEERSAALLADLLSTRRGPEGTEDAVEVWRRFEASFAEPLLPDISDDPDIRSIRAGMAGISDLVAAMRTRPPAEDDLTHGRAVAIAVSEACRSLARRVRIQAEGAWPTSS